MRIRVDRDLCQGHGVCCEEAPAVFELDRATDQVRVLQPEPGEEERVRVQSAVRYCPTRALALEE